MAVSAALIRFNTRHVNVGGLGVMSRYLLSLSLFVVGLLNTIPASAQEDSASELYGYGVHAYHSKMFGEAFDLLSQSIQHSDKDPRAFYFRGLAQHNLGRVDEAKGDFVTAAELEAMGTNRKYNISVALERVQGQVRLDIEKARRNARIKLKSAKRQRDKIKYDKFKAAEGAALLDPNRPATAPDLSNEADDPTSPFADKGDDAANTDVAGADAPAGGTTEPADPFAAPGAGDAPADADAATTPAEPEDPFAVPGDTKAAPPANTTPEDPFAVPGDKKAVPPANTTPEDPFAVPGDKKAVPPTNTTPDDPFAVPGDKKAVPPANTPPADTGGAANNGGPAGPRKGALGGIFRSFGNLVPSPGSLPSIPGLGGESKPEAFDSKEPGPGAAPGANPGNANPGAPADPFGDLK
jgi:hypothetical protein